MRRIKNQRKSLAFYINVYLNRYLIRMVDRSQCTDLHRTIHLYDAEIYEITGGYDTVEACEEVQEMEFVGYGESDESLRDALKTAVYETKNEIVRKLRMEAYEEKRFWKL